jgi:hypothetical protein
VAGYSAGHPSRPSSRFEVAISLKGTSPVARREMLACRVRVLCVDDQVRSGPVDETVSTPLSDDLGIDDLGPEWFHRLASPHLPQPRWRTLLDRKRPSPPSPRPRPPNQGLGLRGTHTGLLLGSEQRTEGRPGSGTADNGRPTASGPPRPRPRLSRTAALFLESEGEWSSRSVVTSHLRRGGTTGREISPAP